jgi:hypothetical protein
MSAPLQTLLALTIVAIAAVWLTLRAMAKRRNPGCGGSCGAVSPEVRKLQAHLKRHG